jgi:L-gulonolactone oxidase
MVRQASAGWRNWSNTYAVTPARIEQPASVDEVVAAVCRAAEDELSVKAVGSGHSFTDIAVTRGVMLNLAKLTGISYADRHTGVVTVGAGTVLAELNVALWQLGLSLPGIGDIDAQTIAGAIATGTHGSGRRIGGLASQVRGLQLVTADGKLLECSAQQHPELFAAARVGLGALGIVTAVTLQCEPAFVLRAVQAPGDYDDLLEVIENLERLDYFEFYWFPNTRRVLTKVQSRLPGDTPLQPLGRLRGWRDDQLLANTVFGALNRLTMSRPGLTSSANRIAARTFTERQYTDRAYRVFSSERRVVYRAMEYAVPLTDLAHVLDEIDSWLEHSGEQVSFPVQVRLSAGDNIPLSPAFGRESCHIAVRQYHLRPHETYFSAVEAIARQVGGRPHWGKLHYRTAEDLAPAYPLFGEFLQVRDRYDPDRRFGNDYLRRVLGS